MSRRRLLGSALTLGAGAAIGSTVSFPSMGAPVAAAAGQDQVHTELIRQLKEGVRAMRGERPGEAARRVASTLRVLAAHYQATGVDEQVTRELRKAIAREGRDAVLRWEPNAAMRAAEAREFGMADVPLVHEPVDIGARERALNALLSRGATAALRDAAAALEQLSPRLDRRSVALAAARQYSCPDLSGQLLFLEYVTLASCLINIVLCAGFQGGYWGLKFGIWIAGC